MRENQTILRAFELLCRREQASAALATVVQVAGSSYRRPGARMLVAGDGRTWGGVSGGCLEREVIRRARLVIDSGKAMLCRFDTTDEFDDSDAARGAALGCAGVIDIFIQPVDSNHPGPMEVIGRVQRTRVGESVATVLKSVDSSAGSCCVMNDSWMTGIIDDGETSVFCERIEPPQSLVVFGGGVDVVPVVEFAKALGWHVSVIVSHGSVGYRERFAEANVVSLGSESDPLGGIAVEQNAAVVLMTHNYVRDLVVLERLLKHPPRYLGMLGPRRRAERLVLESADIPAEVIEKLYAPVGLDIGATTPETIALAIVAEIQAVLAEKHCGSLRDRRGPIYDHAGDQLDKPYEPSACPIPA